MRATHTALILAPLVLASCLGSMLSGCTRKPGTDAPKTTEILSDRDKAVPTEGAVTLQERNPYPVDDKQRSYATLADVDERAVASDKPATLGESKPTR